MNKALSQVVLYQVYFAPDSKRQLQIVFGYAPGSSIYHHVAIDYWSATGFNINDNLSRMPQYLARYVKQQLEDPHSVFESLRQQLKTKAGKELGSRTPFRIVSASASGVPIPARWNLGHGKAENWPGVIRMNFRSHSGILIQALSSSGYLEGLQFPVSFDVDGSITDLQRYYQGYLVKPFELRNKEEHKIITLRIRGQMMETEFASNSLWTVAARKNRPIRQMIADWRLLNATVKEWESVPRELFKYLKSHYVYENIPRR